MSTVVHPSAMLLWSAVLSIPAPLAAAAPSQAAAPAGLVHSTDSTHLVLSYRQYHDALAEQDATPLVRVFGDGRVRVHLPFYMKRAGDYEMRLTASELQSLLDELHARGVTTFDREAVAARRARAQAERASVGGDVLDISDNTWTIIRLRLERLADPARGLALRNLDHTITWPNVEWDARHFPSVTRLRDLDSAERAIRALMSDERLRAVAAPTGDPR